MDPRFITFLGETRTVFNGFKKIVDPGHFKTVRSLKTGHLLVIVRLVDYFPKGTKDSSPLRLFNDNCVGIPISPMEKKEVTKELVRLDYKPQPPKMGKGMAGMFTPLVVSILAGIVVGAISYFIGIADLPSCSDNDTQCREKHLRDGFWTGASVAAFCFITWCLHQFLGPVIAPFQGAFAKS